MDWEERLVAIERELAAGDGEAYRKHVREDALVIVPGETLDKEGTVAAIEEAGGWDRFEVIDPRAVQLREGAALVTYLFNGIRGGFDYSALLSSAYVCDEGGTWKLVFHQQTPVD